MSNPKGQVTVYCCGGAGLNIGTQLEQHSNQEEIGFANLRVVYIDTSKSNTRNHINHSNSYIIDGLDGSGKVRKENHAEINKHILAILEQHQSTDLNIVLSSTGGGSGSVIAPLIASELLDRGIATIVIGIGGVESTLAASNSLKTLKSYESIATMRKTPITMFYVENERAIERSQADPRIATDKKVIGAVVGLCILFSRENRELDSKDLAHWLMFDKVTTYRPQLVGLSLVEKSDNFTEIGNVISVATLAKEGMSTNLPQVPEYQCVGFIPDGVSTLIQDKAPMHFVTSDGIIPETAKHLGTILKDLESKANARLKNQGILSQQDQADTGSGLVL